MLAEWSVECSADDPVLVVPWKDPESDAAFIDLRADPYDLDHIPEAERNPPLMHALRALNASRSPVFTAKCDAWALAADELEHLQIDLDRTPAEAPHGFASYIDLIWRDRSVFTSFHQQEQMLHRIARHAAAFESASAALDCVLRPAIVDIEGPQEGYAVSLYVKALGEDAQAAWTEWSAALGTTVALLRGRDLAR